MSNRSRDDRSQTDRDSFPAPEPDTRQDARGERQPADVDDGTNSADASEHDDGDDDVAAIERHRQRADDDAERPSETVDRSRAGRSGNPYTERDSRPS